MNNLLSILAYASALHAATPTQLIVAVSPNLPSPVRHDAARQVSSLLYDAPAGTTVTVFDAGQLRDLATLTVEDGSLRSRQQRAQNAVRTVFQFVMTNSASGFNVPVVLDEISRQIQSVHSVVLLIGPAEYDNPKEPTLSLLRGWPSDGHLSAGRKLSAFSTKERQHHLDGVSVNWWVTDADAVLNESPREGLGRFWSLFVSTQGGVLASYTPNQPTAFASALEGRVSPCIPAVVDAGDTNVVIRSHNLEVHQESDPVPTPPENVAAAHRDSITNVVPQLPPAILPRVASGNTGIGIVWGIGSNERSAIDLDLYVWVPRDGTELSFHRPRSASGHYYRDIRQGTLSASGDWKSSWEFAELEGDQLPEAVWVNIFAGRGPVQGELRVQFKGAEHVMAFVFPAVTGRSGADSSRRETSDQWIKLDLRSLRQSP